MSNPGLTAEEVIKRIQAKLGEQNEVIREQQLQIQEQQNKIMELEAKIEALTSAESERNELLNKLAELVD